MNPAFEYPSTAAVTKDAPHPNAGKLFLDFRVSPEGQALYRDADYMPVDPDVPPKDPAFRPDGDKFKANYVPPWELDTAIANWAKIYDQVFK